MTDDDSAFPPTFDVSLTARQSAILRCVELMERLTDEHGGEGRVRNVSENKIAVELVFDIPPKDEEP